MVQRPGGDLNPFALEFTTSSAHPLEVGIAMGLPAAAPASSGATNADRTARSDSALQTAAFAASVGRTPVSRLVLACLREVSRSRSYTRLGLLNPCRHAQTPHGDGVCGTSRMYSLKAHTGFEPVPPP